MSEGLIASLVTGGVSLLGTVITVLATSKKQMCEINTKMAVLEERIKAQKESIDKHNNFGQRIPVIEEQIKVVNHRLSDLERE